MKEFKIGKIIEIKNEWYEFQDYILHSVFNYDYKEYEEDGKKIKYVEFDKKIEKEYVFIKQMFPYQVEGEHWVMWYPTEYQVKSDEEISDDIYFELKEIVGSENFDFCWYINPTMTVKEFFMFRYFGMNYKIIVYLIKKYFFIKQNFILAILDSFFYSLFQSSFSDV